MRFELQSILNNVGKNLLFSNVHSEKIWQTLAHSSVCVLMLASKELFNI
jgi:hypothetical protein